MLGEKSFQPEKESFPSEDRKKKTNLFFKEICITVIIFA